MPETTPAPPEYFPVEMSIIKDLPYLNGGAIKVFLWLAHHCAGEYGGKNRIAYPTKATIAKGLKCSMSTVHKGCAQLVKRKIIEVIPGKPGKSSRYKFIRRPNKPIRKGDTVGGISSTTQGKGVTDDIGKSGGVTDDIGVSESVHGDVSEPVREGDGNNSTRTRASWEQESGERENLTTSGQDGVHTNSKPEPEPDGQANLHSTKDAVDGAMERFALLTGQTVERVRSYADDGKVAKDTGNGLQKGDTGKAKASRLAPDPQPDERGTAQGE